MAKPWRHPDTQVFYLRRQVPEAIRGEIGRALWKVSLRTRDPGEAARLFLIANADLEQRFADARAKVALQAEHDQISAERAEVAVAKLLESRPSDIDRRWPSLPLTWWLEDTADNLFGTGAPGSMPRLDATGRHDFKALQDVPLAGDAWLRAIRDLPRAKWLQACGMVLGPLFGAASPPIVRMPENEATLMAAWNERVLADNARLHADRDSPSGSISAPRLRPHLRLRELLKEWNTAKKPRPQTLHEVAGSVHDFIDWFGDVSVATISRDMVFDYRDLGQQLPKAMPAADRKLPLRERLAKHPGGADRVSPATVKKRVGAIQTLIAFAESERWIAGNPAAKVPINGVTRGRKARRSFRDGELTVLFASKLFTEPETWFSRPGVVTDVTLYWLFLLGLTSGARLEEVGQARLADVKTDAGVLFIDIDERETEDVEQRKAEDKSIKNEGSRRCVPIHARLEKLGFPAYCEALRQLGAEALFPDLRANKFGKVTKEASRSANRIINGVVSKDARLVFYSFRHKFKDEGRAAGIQDTVLDQITGHSPATVGAGYGDGISLKPLKTKLNRIKFAMISWDNLEQAAVRVDWNAIVARLITHSQADRA